ncbi:MAG: MBL fold metallo-hydrolase, partial [Desulforhopalus sp.]
PTRVNGGDLRVSYVGHATVLIQTGGLNILTDPVLSDRASPVKWAGPRRVHPPGIELGNLPAIDVILISHNHYDHLDLPALEQLWLRSRPRIIVPLGNDSIIAEYNSEIKSEAWDWGDEVQLTEDLSVHLDPMHHWSARGFFDRNRALWAAYTITGPEGNIYFAGDTGYGNGDYFRAAKEKYKSFRLAILPIGAYEPRWFMAYGHMNPEECLRTFKDLGGPMVLPIHHKVFQLADTGYNQPLEALEAAIGSNEKVREKFLRLMVGEGRYIPAAAR